MQLQHAKNGKSWPFLYLRIYAGPEVPQFGLHKLEGVMGLHVKEGNMD